MMVTEFAKKQSEAYIGYVAKTLKSRQAAKSIMMDFRKTIGRLHYVAGSLPLLENMELASYGYRRINFDRHNFFMLYRVKDRVVIVDAIYHGLQDYEKFL